MTTDSVIPFWFDRALCNPSENNTIVVDQTIIHYTTWGNIGKPGLVLIHGSNAHLEWWRFIAPFLADQFRVAALDLSGNGNSGWRKKYRRELFAQEVHAVCEAAQLGPEPIVVGHSFGGFVALETAHQYGSQLGGLIMMDFTVSPPERYTEWGLRAERDGVLENRKTKVYENIETALGRFRFIPEQPNLHPYVMEYIGRASLRQVEGGWTWKFDPSLFDHLEMGIDQSDKFVRLKCRSALILAEQGGDEGGQDGAYMSEITAGVMPVFSIPGTYHHLMFDEPLAVAMSIKAIALAWLREDGSDRMQQALQFHLRSDD